MDRLSRSDRKIFIRAAVSLKEKEFRIMCPFTPKTNDVQVRRRKPVFDLLYEDARRKQARLENQVYVKQVQTILLRGSGSTKVHEKLFGSSKLLQQKLKAQKEEYERIASLDSPFKPRTT